MKMGSEVLSSSRVIPTSVNIAQSPAINAIGVIKKAFKLLVKDEKLFLPVILLALSPFSLLVLLHYLVAGPLLLKVEEAYETSSLDPKDAWALVGIEIPFLISFSLVWLFGTSITIFASAKSYSAKSATLKELLSLWILPSTWKKPIITWLYISLLMMGYIIVLLLSLSLLIGREENANSTSIWLMAGIFIAATYPYFASVWTLGLVISVVEEENEHGYGTKVFSEARKLMGGRRLHLLHGYLLMLILVVLSIPISIVFYLTTADDDDEIGTMMRFGFMLVATVFFCLTNLFTFVVFTVFYFECKQSSGHGHGEFESGYCLVPAVVCEDTSLP